MPEIDNWSINRLLSTAARMLEHSWNNRLKELGLTHAGVTALGVISREGTVSQVRVASIVGVQAQTMGKTLTRLESHGYIFRVRNNVDRRSYLLGITASGKEMLAKAEQIDRELASAGELANLDFRRLLVQIVMDLSDQNGNEAILKGASEYADTSVGFSEYADQPSPQTLETIRSTNPEDLADDASAGTVMDVVTEDLIAEHDDQDEIPQK